MRYGYIPAPHSIFCHTFKLEQGYYLVLNCKQKQLKLEKYWDIIDVYNSQHEDNPLLTIIKESCYEHKPEGIFDCVLFELSEWIPQEKEDILSYFDWIHEHLIGNCIIEYNKYNVVLLQDLLVKFNYIELSEGYKLGAKKKWIILTKK